jgi:arginase
MLNNLFKSNLTMRSLSVIGAPIYTLSKFSGMKLSPSKLRRIGLVKSLKEDGFEVSDKGDAELVGPMKDEGPSNIKNLETFRKDTSILTTTIKKVLGEEPILILGGECSLIIGSLNALRSKIKGKPGILWFDAHGDFNTPDTTPSGYIGGMCLSFACGRAREYTKGILLTEPLDESLVVHVGSRALDKPEEEAMLSSEVELIKADGLDEEEASKKVKERLDGADWIILHLDVDVLDPDFLSPLWPSVNYPVAGGLSPSQVVRISSSALSTGRVKAIHVTAYNAKMDVDNTSSKNLIELIRRLLR